MVDDCQRLNRIILVWCCKTIINHCPTRQPGNAIVLHLLCCSCCDDETIASIGYHHRNYDSLNWTMIHGCIRPSNFLWWWNTIVTMGYQCCTGIIIDDNRAKTILRISRAAAAAEVFGGTYVNINIKSTERWGYRTTTAISADCWTTIS